MRAPFVAVALAAAGLLAGCGPKLIPGSEIKDTRVNREIVDVVAAYKRALEARDVPGIMKLVSPSFFETSGTPEGSDDYDYAGLEARLKAWAEKTQAVRADIGMKSITIEGDRAKAQYFYELNFQLERPNEPAIWKREADTNQITLKREEGAWRIVAGI